MILLARVVDGVLAALEHCRATTEEKSAFASWAALIHKAR
jgi:hypothetical protein